MRHLATCSCWPALIAFLVGAVLLLPDRAAAQTHALRVTIRDARGQELTGITVHVRSEDSQPLVQATTSVSGTVTFANLPTVVRVAVEGQPRTGPELYQLGDDAQGVRLDLAQHGQLVTLDLRVDHDGLVLPDPATMLTLEEGGPIAETAPAIPTALLATPAPLPTAAVRTTAVTVGDVGPAQRRAPRRDRWVPWMTVLIIAFAAGVMRLVQRRRAAR